MASQPLPFPGLQSPGAGFDQPFEMLSACHDRVRRSLALLLRLQEHLRQAGSDTQAQSAARDVLRYFDIAAPQHHDDEERHLVPRLRASTDPAARAAAERMLADHVRIRAGWARLHPLLRAVAEGRPPADDFDWAATHFIELHRDHLVLEDETAFVHAEALMRAEGEAAVAAMGEEMAARRGAQRSG